MAQAQVKNLEGSDAVILTAGVRHVVEVKNTWSGGWQVADYLEAKMATLAVAPSISSADLVLDYGKIKREDRSLIMTESPLAPGERYVRIRRLDPFVTDFVGIIEADAYDVHGRATGADTGIQKFKAFGLEQLLQRQNILGSRFQNGSGVHFIDRVLDFNERDDAGTGGVLGNRSSAQTGDKVYVYSADGAEWSHRDMAEYLLRYFSPQSVSFRLAGQVDALENIKTAVRPRGTLFDALNQIINPRFGVGWYVQWRASDDGVAVTGGESADALVCVYTLTDVAIPTSGGGLPANVNQARIDMFQGRDVLVARLQRLAQNQYDRIVVRGKPVVVCATFSYADGTLEKAWTPALETEYNAAPDDVARQANKFSRVYVMHRVPRDWNLSAGNGEGGAPLTASPGVKTDGTLDAGSTAPMRLFGKSFLHRLPLLDGWKYSGASAVNLNPAGAEPKYLAPFAWIRDPDTDDIFLTEKAGEGKLPGASLHMPGKELALEIRPGHPVHYGLNHFTGFSGQDAQIDYTSIHATLAFETDTHLQVTESIVAGQLAENGRTLLVEVDDAELHYVVPGTIVDIVDGKPVRFYGGVIRSDAGRLRQIAAQYKAWFGKIRQAVEFARKGLVTIAPRGAMIVDVSGGASGSLVRQEVGTVVTQVIYDYEDLRTAIRTDYFELDFFGKIVTTPMRTDDAGKKSTTTPPGGSLSRSVPTPIPERMALLASTQQPRWLEHNP